MFTIEIEDGREAPLQPWTLHVHIPSPPVNYVQDNTKIKLKTKKYMLFDIFDKSEEYFYDYF